MLLRAAGALFLVYGVHVLNFKFSAENLLGKLGASASLLAAHIHLEFWGIPSDSGASINSADPAFDVANFASRLLPPKD